MVKDEEEEGERKVEPGGLRRRQQSLGLTPSFLRRKSTRKEGDREGETRGKKDKGGPVVIYPPEKKKKKEQERQDAQRRQQNLFSLLVQANDNDNGPSSSSPPPPPPSSSSSSSASSSSSSTSSASKEGGRTEEDRGNDDRLELQELLGNAFIFLLAGHETSAHTLVWALLLLALNPDEQAAAHEEVLRVLGPPSLPSSPSSSSSSSMTYDQLSHLPYCQGVMNEALRLFPPIVTVPKLCTADTTLTLPTSSSSLSPSPSSFRVPKGAEVFLHVYSVHRNPKHYVEPEAFKPRRWRKAREKEGGGGKGEEQYMDIDPFAFVPFSLGERSCLGRRFGQMTVMTTLALLLQRYEIGVVGRREERTEEWEERKARMLKTENTLTLGPKDKKVQLVFTRR